MVTGDGKYVVGHAGAARSPNLFGQVASVPTAWRTLEAIDDAALARIAAARAEALKRAFICDAKDTGLANLPSKDFAINSAWLRRPMTLAA